MKITKLVFDAKNGITCLEMEDEGGNLISPLNVENSPVSGPKKTNLEILTEFCAKKKLQPGIKLPSLIKFFKTYEAKAPAWKGEFRVASLWEKWLLLERD